MSAVGDGSVRDRVARVKSSKRNRSTTVRPTRPDCRMRCVTRSTMLRNTASSSPAAFGRRPSARCEPIEERRFRACTGRGSRLCASALSFLPAATPTRPMSVSSGRSATSPTVESPTSWSFAAVTAPTPQRRSTASGRRNSSSPVGSTRSRPSGFATPLATLARNFVRATPTVMLRPTSAATCSRRLRDLERGPGYSAQAANVQKRFIDRDALDQRGRVIEHRKHVATRL